MRAKTRIAATLTVTRPADMTPEQRAALARWLRVQANTIVTEFKRLSNRYTARYHVNVADAQQSVIEATRK